MKKIKLILIGGGFSSIEIIDLIDDINKIDKKQFIEIAGILDDQKKINSKINGVKIVGKLKDVRKFKNEKFFVNIFDRNNRFIRPKLIKKLKINLSKFYSIIHPHNLLGKNVKVGAGVSIYPGCTIFSNSKIGNFSNIMPNVSIASNSIIEDNCFIGKDVFIGSGSKVKKNVYISNSSTILENTLISEGNRIIPHSLINSNFKKKNKIIGGLPAKILFSENISVYNSHNSSLNIRLADKRDLQFLFKLYNRNILDKKFFSSKQVDFVSHRLWFNNKIKEKMFYVCLKNKRKVGYVRFEKIDNKNLSISIAIKNSFKRNGYGKKMLNKVLNNAKFSKFNIIAFILNKNSISKKFFTNAGFKLIASKKYEKYMKKAKSL